MTNPRFNHRQQLKRLGRLGPTLLSSLFFLLVLIGLMWFSGTVHSQVLEDPTIFDDDLNLSNGISLRQAIITANEIEGHNTIVLDAGTYTLTMAGGGENSAEKGDLDIVGELTIEGQGAGETIINGNEIDRVFDVLGGSALTITKVTIKNGDNNPDGGGIHSDGSLIVKDVVFYNNNSNSGGGILSNGPLIVENSTFAFNSGSSGGGIYHLSGEARVSGSTFMSNTAYGNDGGGIVSVGAPCGSLTAPFQGIAHPSPEAD